MSYKKPQIVAKSAAKQTYVAGCPLKEATCLQGIKCSIGNCR